ncbi:MAG: hypothetical protein WC860_07680 [Candidatus Margulisiibacteriota bacterium]|jgi:ureidoglycolate hydrolase
MEFFNEIKNITKENFAKYGTICEHNDPTKEYEPLVIVNSKGWIWAVLTFKHRQIDYIECHPTSKESFEPVFGTTILVLATPDNPTQTESFLLDKPVMLNEGVWHNVFTLSCNARVKITENNDVTSVYHKLTSPVMAVLVQ